MGHATEGVRVDDDSRPPPSPDDGDSVLLLAPAMSRGVDEACVDLGCRCDASAVSLLSIELDGGVDSVLDRWNRHCDRTPERVAVVTAGEIARGAAATASGGSSVSLPGNSVSNTSVSSPGDLTGLGIRASECLSAWEELDGDVVVCFRSLTTLIQFTEVQRVFQFVHVLTQRIEAAGARAHFHMDPGAHDDRTVATIRSLFEEVLEQDPDGTWRRH